MFFREENLLFIIQRRALVHQQSYLHTNSITDCSVRCRRILEAMILIGNSGRFSPGKCGRKLISRMLCELQNDETFPHSIRHCGSLVAIHLALASYCDSIMMRVMCFVSHSVESEQANKSFPMICCARSVGVSRR